MIKSINVTNYLGDSITIDLTRPELSGFVVVSISGLGPVKANINTTELAAGDGCIFNSSRLSNRNIVILLKHLWQPNIETTRQLSYKYFPVKKKIKLVIETDNRKVETEGYVESNESEMFSSSGSSGISIICPDPFFYSTGDGSVNTTSFNSITGGFEFPFCNNSLTESLLEMGSINSKYEKVITYNGDSEIGIIMHIHAVGEVRNITIQNKKTGGTLYIDTDKMASFTGSGIITGDDIVICTIKGKKYVKLIRNGESKNIINCLGKNTEWFQLSRGDNIFSYMADNGAGNLQFKIENQTVYEGV